MNDSRPKFPILANFYAAFFVGGLVAAPLLTVAQFGKQQAVSGTAWVLAGVLSILVVTLLGYANTRCSGEHLTYREGLLFVTSSMMTGWPYLSVFVVFPALLLTVIGSVGLALFNDLVGARSQSPRSFHRLVAVFHRHRMRQ